MTIGEKAADCRLFPLILQSGWKPVHRTGYPRAGRSFSWQFAPPVPFALPGAPVARHRTYTTLSRVLALPLVVVIVVANTVVDLGVPGLAQAQAQGPNRG